VLLKKNQKMNRKNQAFSYVKFVFVVDLGLLKKYRYNRHFRGKFFNISIGVDFAVIFAPKTLKKRAIFTNNFALRLRRTA
jgi:hypothetical protein